MALDEAWRLSALVCVGNTSKVAPLKLVHTQPLSGQTHYAGSANAAAVSCPSWAHTPLQAPTLYPIPALSTQEVGGSIKEGVRSRNGARVF